MMTRVCWAIVLAVVVAPVLCYGQADKRTSVRVGTFLQEVSEAYDEEHGLPHRDVRSLALGGDGTVFAATALGLGVYSSGAWSSHQFFQNSPIHLLEGAPQGYVCGISPRGLFVATADAAREFSALPRSVDPRGIRSILWDDGHVYLGTSEGVYVAYRAAGELVLESSFERVSWARDGVQVMDMAISPSGTLAVATTSMLHRWDRGDESWSNILPQDGQRSWAPRDVQALTFGGDGSLYFASPQGVGVGLGDWRLYSGKDGLPWNGFTSIALAEDGAVWFGTNRGAIKFDGEHWAYRQGRRWLPNDHVRDVVVDRDGSAWFATAEGVGVIRRVPMTLKEKADFFETEIDNYHRRTPYGYVLEVGLPEAGVKRDVRKHDSDNDGLWTCMYGAGECFAYAATGDPRAKARAVKVFEAMRFLNRVTQGGSHPAPKGYVARTVLPTSGHDPNAGRLERDRHEQETGDALWKVIDPRWPVSEDKQWYWKSDTSSDELDGHYFFYARYYDLVAETEEEKREVREQVRALTDHIVEHGFNLVDHDGKPTRWARYGPEELNFDRNWFAERGLNSLSMVSYLAVAEHVTGDAKYGEIASRLVEEHGYAQNILYPKFQRGVGTGNQSDDEMAFMCYYNLLSYETDPVLRSRYALSFWQYWRLEEPELNPFFNIAFAAQVLDGNYADAFGRYRVNPGDTWLAESVDTLKRFPLDRVNWRHTNSHRLDIVPVPDWTRGFDDGPQRGRGVRANGKVLPVDERFFNHWNTDPFRLDQGGDGRGLADGAVFLLPYYMGLYHEFIED